MTLCDTDTIMLLFFFFWEKEDDAQVVGAVVAGTAGRRPTEINPEGL